MKDILKNVRIFIGITISYILAIAWAWNWELTDELLYTGLSWTWVGKTLLVLLGSTLVSMLFQLPEIKSGEW